MSWTQETVIKLIKKYRKHEILWNPSNPKYFNRIFKGHAWKKIAQEMDMSEGAVKAKMENLSAQLRRERTKMVKVTKRGLVFTSSWYGFEHLRFLLNRRKHYKGRVYGEDTNESNNSQIGDLLVPQTNNVPNESNLKQVTEKVLRPKKNVGTEKTSMKKSVDIVNRMRKSVDTETQQMNSVVTDDQMMKSAYSILASTTSNSVEEVLVKSATDASAAEADQIYANFIASKFRMYSQQTKNTLQYKISNLLFQADTGIFDIYDQTCATVQQKTRASQTESQQPRPNESDSLSASPENKRTGRTCSEDRTPIRFKIEYNSDTEDPLNDDYENII